MQVSLLDLKLQYEQIKKEVLRNGHYILGPNVRAFKEEITQYCGTKYAIGVASGMEAFE